MYNSEIKERFLNNYIDNTARNYRYILEKGSATEEFLQKDIYEFAATDRDNLLYSYSNRSKLAVDVVVSCLRKYVDWCINQGLVSDRINYFSSIGGSDLEKYIDQTVANNKYVTLEQLIDIEGACENAQDAVCVELPFIGIKGEKASEILGLKISDVKEDRIILPDREIMITPRTYSLIQEAIDQTEYITGNGDNDNVIGKKRTMNDSEYVIKCSGRTKYEMTYLAYINRISRIKKYFDNQYITVNNLWVSGMIHILKQIKSEKGELSKEDYQKINCDFGFSEIYWYQTKVRVEPYL